MLVNVSFKKKVTVMVNDEKYQLEIESDKNKYRQTLKVNDTKTTPKKEILTK